MDNSPERNNGLFSESAKATVVTYIGLASATIGISLAIRGIIQKALICLIVSGICDLIDGPIARRCKRTEEEKQYGIQLDSLVDVVSFLCLPVVINLQINNGIIATITYAIYLILGVSRLAEFNTKAEIDVIQPYFKGFPVTFVALVLPIWYIAATYANLINYTPILTALIGVLFISEVPFKKPTVKSFPVFIIIALITIIFLIRI